MADARPAQRRADPVRQALLVADRLHEPAREVAAEGEHAGERREEVVAVAAEVDGVAEADVEVAAVGHLDDRPARRLGVRLGVEDGRPAVRRPVAERGRDGGLDGLGLHVAHERDRQPVGPDVVGVVLRGRLRA